MTDSSAAEQNGLRFDDQVLGLRQPWTVLDRGLEYTGEVVVADDADAELGRRLEGDLYFRVVLNRVPRRIPAEQIQDRRIAMAVPRSAPDQSLESLGREILSIRESRTQYVTATDPDTSALRSSLGRQESSLRDELERLTAISFAQGRVYASAGITVDPAEVFSSPGVEEWIDRIVVSLFRQAYPSLPFDHEEIPSALTADRVAAVYQALIQGQGDSQVSTRFGPALRLSTRNTPDAFDATASSLIEVIDGELGRGEGRVSVQELLQRLCYEHGLNRLLATLYVLAYVRHADAELTLFEKHTVRLTGGNRLRGARITADLLADVPFAASLADELRLLAADESDSWDSVLPYAGLLALGLEPSDQPEQVTAMEERLLEALGKLGERTAATRIRIESMVAGLDGAADAEFEALQRLAELCQAGSYRAFRAIVVAGFQSPSELKKALDVHSKLERLAGIADEIGQIRRYLDSMTFGRTDGDLVLSRDSVQAMIEFDDLVRDPTLWARVERGFQQLRHSYRVTYLGHHSAYHSESAEILSGLERLRPQVEALQQFNRVPEFGGPVEDDLPWRFDNLARKLKSCTASDDDLPLDDAPMCHRCELSLQEQAPRQEAALVQRDVERAMRTYNRRLSSEGARRILASPTQEQLDVFVKLVQVSDLSALANILDDQVVEFLRTFVSGGDRAEV